MRALFIALLVALAAPAMAGRVLLEDVKLEEPKAEATMFFKAATATYDPVTKQITFTGTGDLETSIGKTAKMNEAFAPGKFKPEQKGDGVISGTLPSGQKVKTIIRVAEPVSTAADTLTLMAEPATFETVPLLSGGEVEKAKHDDDTKPWDATKPATLSDVYLVVDSRAAPKAPEGDAAAQPAAAQPTEVKTRRLSHWGEWHAHRAGVAGAVVGNAICDGSVVCAAVGYNTAYHNHDHWGWGWGR